MFELKFSTANAAFDDCELECKRILREVIKKLERGQTGGNCLDSNGNTVGSWRMK